MKYCPECGAKLLTQKFCQECGANISKYESGSQETSQNGIGGFDFSFLEKEAKNQLGEKEKQDKINEEFDIQNGVLIKYKGKGGKVVIPKMVTSIGAHAFDLGYDVRESITEVIFEGNITEIGESAFSGCFNMKNIVLPKGLKKIGKEAFSSVGITGIQLPDGVIIGDGAFARSCLTSITIPRSVTFEEPRFFQEIGVFNSCKDLQRVYIENGMTKIYSKMFYRCSSLYSITLPESVAVIDTYAFAECKNLAGITLPRNLTSIGTWAFSECSSLSLISIPRGVSRIGAMTFSYCTKLSTVELPGELRSIDECAFQDCKYLTSITIPEGVTKIDDTCFLGCDSLTTVKMPARLASGIYFGSNVRIVKY